MQEVMRSAKEWRIRMWGGREAVIQTLRREGGVVLKNFSAFESQFDPKIGGGGLPGPLPWTRHRKTRWSPKKASFEKSNRVFSQSSCLATWNNNVNKPLLSEKPAY